MGARLNLLGLLWDYGFRHPCLQGSLTDAFPVSPVPGHRGPPRHRLASRPHGQAASGPWGRPGLGPGPGPPRLAAALLPWAQPVEGSSVGIWAGGRARRRCLGARFPCGVGSAAGGQSWLQNQTGWGMYTVDFIVLRFYLCIHQTWREAETQAEGEAAPCGEPDMGLNPRTLGSRPGRKADAHPQSPPGTPNCGY